MGNIEIFNNSNNLLVTVLTLVLLFMCCSYAGRSKSISAGVWFLFFGLLLEFCGSALESEISYIYSQGRSINFLVFIELLLLLISMILLAFSASQFLTNYTPGAWIVLSISVVGFFIIAFFIYIAPDGVMVTNMRQIFPLAAFAYLAVSFWSQLSQKSNGGYILAALVTSAVTIYLILRFFNVEFATDNLWYIPAFVYVLLSVSVIMIRVNAVEIALEKTVEEVNKYNNRIDEIIKSSPFPIIISRLKDDKIILANNNAVKLFGIQTSELDRYRLKDFFADADNRRLLNERLEQEREVQDFEVLVKTPISDTPFWLLASANVIDYNYDVVLYSAFQDITSRKNRESLLKNQAIRDPLTSLYNRRYFEEEVSKRILDAKRENSPYSVLMLDADLFKRVNDTFGHKTGDKVLIELALTSERALRDKDIVARYGGEEFVVFLPKINAAKAKIVADRLRESIAAVVVYSDDNKPVTFTVSIGVSSSDISDNIDTLIKTADEALYRAKQNGRNRVEVFTRADMKQFDTQGLKDRKNENSNHHPIFDKENMDEISLLDGIGANHIQGSGTSIEPEDGFPMLGIKPDDLR